MEPAKRLPTLLGVLAIGDGVMLTLMPQRYLGFWTETLTRLMAKARPKIMDHPQIPRLLGMAETGLALWFVARRLSH